MNYQGEQSNFSLCQGTQNACGPCRKHHWQQATVFLKTLLDFLVHLHQKAEALTLEVLWEKVSIW